MTDFIDGENRNQATLFPERLDDYITEDNAVRVIDVFIDGIDLSGMGFKTVPEVTGDLLIILLPCLNSMSTVTLTGYSPLAD